MAQMTMASFVTVLSLIWEEIMVLLYKIGNLYVTFPFLMAALCLFVLRLVINLFKYIVH